MPRVLPIFDPWPIALGVLAVVTGIAGGTAHAVAGASPACARIVDQVQRSQCELRESSKDRLQREASRAGQEAVEREQRAAGGELGRRWDQAVQQARTPDLSSMVLSREGALAVGLTWLAAALWRERRRRQRRRGVPRT